MLTLNTPVHYIIIQRLKDSFQVVLWSFAYTSFVCVRYSTGFPLWFFLEPTLLQPCRGWDCYWHRNTLEGIWNKIPEKSSSCVFRHVNTFALTLMKVEKMLRKIAWERFTFHDWGCYGSVIMSQASWLESYVWQMRCSSRVTYQLFLHPCASHYCSRRALNWLVCSWIRWFSIVDRKRTVCFLSMIKWNFCE
jgi:hypothetical protein